MRTTLTLSDEAAQFVSHYAQARALRMGEAVSELVMQAKEGLVPKQPTRFKRVNGIPVFDVPKGIKTVTTEDVKALLDDAL
jgi:hypothetical protein